MGDAISSPRGPHSLRSRVWRLIRLPLVAYLGFCILVGVFQRSLVFHPPSVSTADLDRFAAERQFIAWTNASGSRIGWHRPASVAGARATPAVVLIVHGNAGTAVGREYLADPLQEVFPAEVFLLEYPGYADRPGSPSQASFLAAAEEAFGRLPTGVPVYVVSESIGTGTAAWLAGRHPDRVAGLCCLVPYDRLVRVARDRMPWFPVELMLLDRFPASDWLSDYRGPVAVGVAGEDETIRPARGISLYEQYQGPKKLWVFRGLSHNEAIRQPAAWWREVVQFWNKPPATSPRP